MVAGTAGFLLQHYGQGMHHDSSRHSSAGAAIDSSTYSFPHAPAYAAAHATSDTTAYTTANTTGACWPSGSIQLRCGCREHMGS